MHHSKTHRLIRQAFTLIELLVVISIIGLLVAILLPALSKARNSAKSAQSMSNMRQIGIALNAYLNDNADYFPMHSSSSGQFSAYITKPRWVDYLYTYMPSDDVFRSPSISEAERERMSKIFWYEASSTPAHVALRNNPANVPALPAPANPATHGGYGYNFQYLGNARFSPTFHARAGVDVLNFSDTVVVGDVAGSRKGSAANEPGTGGAAVYSIDPPLGSARGSGKGSYYEGGGDENTGTYDPEYHYVWRSFPAERNNDAASFSFADGHGELLKRTEIDDYDGDGVADNGYWNGYGDATRR